MISRVGLDVAAAIRYLTRSTLEIVDDIDNGATFLAGAMSDSH